MDATELRGLLLGPTFNPRVEDIPTPQLLIDKGVPADILRLVSMSTKSRLELSAAATDGVMTMALYIAACLRMRDSGGADGRGTPVMNAIDAQVLSEQDFDLQSALGKVVGDFLGINAPQAQADAAKNDSGATQANAGGSELPSVSDTIPFESANQE
jgi:hypothetical protein